MATRKYSHRVSYVLSLPGAPDGHRLGINGLAVDVDGSSLYSAGRDGTICSWDLHLDSKDDFDNTSANDNDNDINDNDNDNEVTSLTTTTATTTDDDGEDDDPFSDSHRVPDPSTRKPPIPPPSKRTPNPKPKPQPEAQPTSSKSQPTTLRHQFQAHTHWINDITLVQNNSRLVSASSDTSVRLWPTDTHRDSDISPTTLGRHGDYVKCLSSPESTSTWIASGGLDRKIFLWDLNGAGEVLKLESSDDDIGVKGSVYALSARPQVIASGGPENVVRVWDPRSGKSVTKLIGHTGNIRDILINQSGDTILSASSDQTVKVWSLTAGRCLHTLTMHNDSVWSLYSDHPQLSVFYSADRSGLAMKTDTRRASTVDQGLCVALLQEHEGIQKIIADGGYVWTATQRSSIQRWDDIDTTMEIEAPASNLPSPMALRSQSISPLHAGPEESSESKEAKQKDDEKEKEQKKEDDEDKEKKDEKDEKEKKKKPLTKIPRSAIAPLTITSPFSHSAPHDGPNHIEEEEADLSIPIQIMPNETIEGQYGLIKHAVLNDRRRALTQDTAGDVLMWDLLQCVPIKSFGKRHLDDVFNEVNTDSTMAPWCSLDTRTGRLTVSLDANRCFDAEIYADEAGFEDCSQFREDQRLNYGKWVLRYLFAGLIEEEQKRDDAYRQTLQVATRSLRGDGMDTPSLGTPGFLPPGIQTPIDSPFLHPANPNAQDYFTTGANIQSTTNANTASSEPDASASTTSDNAQDKEEKPSAKRSGSIFGKNLKLSFPKKAPKQSTEVKPPVEEKPEEPEKVEEKEPEYEDSLKGVIDKIRAEYDAALAEKPTHRPVSKITPSNEKETPALAIPSRTSVMIREEISDAVVASDLYRGTVESMARDVDKLESVVPTWLGELLLRNILPYKEIQKLTFTLKPFDNTLPPVAKPDPRKAVDNSRLNANRMLRAKKILAYIAERIDPADSRYPNPYKPEEYLELYCQNIHIPPNMTLYAIRTQIWRSGSDMILYYKSNGKRTIVPLDARPRTGEPGQTTPSASSNANAPHGGADGATSINHSATPSFSAGSSAAAEA